MQPTPDLSVVFPVFNEEENIPILLDEIAKALEGRGWTYEIVAVDDAWRAARGRFVVSLDADLQNDPADIPRMMQKLEAGGADMVIGVRVNRNDTWSRRMQSKIGNGVRNWITNDQITDTGCSLKLVRREA